MTKWQDWGGLSTRPSSSSAVFVGEIREGMPWAGNSTADRVTKGYDSA